MNNIIKSVIGILPVGLEDRSKLMNVLFGGGLFERRLTSGFNHFSHELLPIM